jgi:predicted phosphodiesterase
MRKLVRLLLLKPILWLVDTFSSAPDKERIFDSLSKLRQKIEEQSGKKGFTIPFDVKSHRFIIFSDQHKGAKNGADDFMLAEGNYVAALDYYNKNQFHLIALGDCEELWENTLLQVKKHNKASFEAEANFVTRSAFTKIFGNHDLDWEIDPLATTHLKEIYGTSLTTLEAITLQTTVNGKSLTIFCTHGHQGDLQSDGNWFSKFFVSKIWAPLQAYLRINPNTPAYDQSLKTIHNNIMYEWSSLQKDLILITGHTHQPVFESLTQLERLQRERKETLADINPEWAQALEDQSKFGGITNAGVPDYSRIKPSYFNSGCCCFDDGDITGIEIADGAIRLIKWEAKNGVPKRHVLEESQLSELAKRLH